MSCAAAIETAAERYWGVTHLELLEGLGYVRERSSGGAEDQGSYQWKHQGVPQAEQLRAFLNSKGIGTTQTDADKYWIYNNAYNLSCNQTDGTKITTKVYAVTVDDGVQEVKSKSVKEKSKSQARFYTDNGREEMFCAEDIAQALRNKNLADAYYLALLNHKCKQAGVASTGSQAKVLLEACRAGIQNQGDPDFCSKTYRNDDRAKSACDTGRGIQLTASDLPDTKVSTEPEGEDEAQSSCRIEGVGWLLCPALNFLGGVTDAAYSGVELLLKVPPMVMTGSSTEGVYNAWQAMRSIANVIFVIGFLIIIFSQVSSVGVSNYGVKKTLPRLIVAAVLVNLSFWICAVAVDLSNIIGASMVGFFESIGAGLKVPEVKSGGDWGGAATGEGWLGIVGVIISGGAIAAGLVYLGLSALLPFLITAFLAILTVFIVLTLRQALIVLLIVIAPLAFAAYLLPNTESWFHRWRKFLTTLLLMYPIIGVIFGASALAAQVVMHSSDNIFVQMAGAAITIIPLALTPIIMRTAGGVLSKVGAFVNNPNRGPIDGMRKRASAFREHRQAQRAGNALTGNKRVFGAGQFKRDARRKLRGQASSGYADVGEQAFALTDSKASGYASQIANNKLASNAAAATQSAQVTSAVASNNGASISAALGTAAGVLAAGAIAAQVAKAISDEISNVKLSADFKPGELDKIADAFKQAVKDGDSIKARAHQDMLHSAGGAGMSKWRDAISDLESGAAPGMNDDMSNTLRNHAIQTNPGLKSSDAAAAAWATTESGAQGSRFDAIKTAAGTWSGLSNEQLMGQQKQALNDALDAAAISKQRAQEMINSESFNKVDEAVKARILAIK